MANMNPDEMDAGDLLRSTRQAWGGMKQRCLNPRSPSYHRYGGRGITICARWLTGMDAFVADMGVKPSGRHSLDRIDNDGNYEPGNCRWATSAEQAANTHRSPKYGRIPISEVSPSLRRWLEVR